MKKMKENKEANFPSDSQHPNDEAAEAGPPHGALFLLLTYLPVSELLVLSQVCKSLRDAVMQDVLPWLDVVVGVPLNRKLSDERLMRIASRSEGRLRTLVLINCCRITDYGLLQLVRMNPLIKKLHLPGCSALTPEGVIEAVKVLSMDNHKLKSLSIKGIYNLNSQHFQTLSSYLFTDLENQNLQTQQPFFYHHHRDSSFFGHNESDRVLDVEICPKCNQVTLVFDCPKDTCRGCIHCIPRCRECGMCIGFAEAEDAACQDVLCSGCWLQLPKCNLCNKPYCRDHMNLKSNMCSSGFICQNCDQRFIQNLREDVD